jgi:hypothetical protein
MKIHDLLEDRRDFLRGRYLPLITKKLDQLKIPNNLLGKIAAMPGDFIPEQIFNWLVSRDPTPNRRYLGWILTCAIDRLVPFEDLEYLPDALGQYDELKRTNQLPPEARDINRIRTPSQLDTLLTSNQQSQVTASEEERQAALEQSRVVYQDSNWLVVIPETEQAAQFWGRGTQWCTAYGDPRGLHPKRSCQYAEYAPEGPLVIAINQQQPDERYQFHEASQQYMDRNDEPVDDDHLRSLVKRWTTAMIKSMVRYLPAYLIRFIREPSEEMQLAAVRQDGYAIQHLRDPSEAVQLAAVLQNSESIQHIREPSEAVQLVAVQEDAWVIQYIKNPTPRVIKLAREQGYDRHGHRINP